MALADIEAALDPGVPWRTCAVCHYLSQKDEVWGARLRRMLANRGIKFRDIAAELGMAVGSSKAQLHRARGLLRAKLGA